MRKLLIAIALVSLSACTWVHLDPAAANVRVVPAGAAPAACTKKGEINVSVKNSVGVYNRKALKVRDELETLARNEAPSLRADTIQPLAEPFDGTQRFAGYQCGR